MKLNCTPECLETGPGEYTLILPPEHPQGGGKLTLNSTGVLLLEELARGTDEEGLCALLCDRFDVELPRARLCTRQFLDCLREAECLDEDG